MKKILSLIVFLSFSTLLLAGNPDRQGEAGAAQLLMNPWAPSAGLHTLNTSSISGVEAMRLNPAGLSRMAGPQVMLGYANYLQGTEISLQSIGVGTQIGKNGAFGLSIMSIDFGDIPVTTTAQPNGTGALLNLSFINIGLTYSHTFESKVSVGFTLRGISEATSDISSFGLAIDAGVQYYTGENDEFKFGLSLRNVGSRMSFGGQGISEEVQSPDPSDNFTLTLQQRPQGFEMPSVLNIGVSYDLLTGMEDHRVSMIGNFTANSFSRDQVGVAAEYAFLERFVARAGYRTDLESEFEEENPLYDGLSAGASVRFPFKKGDPNRKFSVDYAFRATRIYDGTHNIGLSLSF